MDGPTDLTEKTALSYLQNVGLRSSGGFQPPSRMGETTKTRLCPRRYDHQVNGSRTVVARSHHYLKDIHGFHDEYNSSGRQV